MVLISTVLGCDVETSNEPRRAPVPEGAAEVEPESGSREATGGPTRGRLVGGEAVARTVEWPDEAELDRSTFALLPAELQDRISVAPGPVLAPSDPRWLDEPAFFVGETWATLVTKHADVTLDLSLSTQATLVPGLRPEMPPGMIRGVPGTLTQNEGIWSVSWIEYGVAYALEIGCATPGRGICADDRGIIALAESLVLVGGEGMQ